MKHISEKERKEKGREEKGEGRKGEEEKGRKEKGEGRKEKNLIKKMRGGSKKEYKRVVLQALSTVRIQATPATRKRRVLPFRAP